MLEIVYQDEFLVAVNKPHGLLVHRSKIAANTNQFALQILRDQLGKTVYPVHRLDRKTSGVLLFALSKEVNSLIQEQFMKREVKKKYVAFVRGFTNEKGTIDYPLKREGGTIQNAVTHYSTVDYFELPYPSSKFKTSRFSFIELLPETGRMHQIRKHLAHILHPIIGDRPHGCNKQNKLFLEKLNMKTMLLHASELSFKHPVTNEVVSITSNLSNEFNRVLNLDELRRVK